MIPASESSNYPHPNDSYYWSSSPIKHELALQNQFAEIDVASKINNYLYKTNITGWKLSQPAQSYQGSLILSSWRELGPKPLVDNTGVSYSGRVTSIVVNSSNPSIIYVGTAQGGVWKTQDSGITWLPLTDSMPSLAIGSMAISQDGKILYVGTGEPNRCSDCYGGSGVYKSTDGGKTWTILGSSYFSGNAISSIITFSTVPNRLLVSVTSAVCCKGFSYFYNPNGYGIFVSPDGGTTWYKTLSSQSGISMVVEDPLNPSTLYAGDFSGSIWRSEDAGQSWQELIYSQQPQGRVALGMSAADPNVLYFAVSSSYGNLTGIFKYNTQLRNITLLSYPPPSVFGTCNNQCWYDLLIYPDPVIPNYIYFGALDFYVSTDGGSSWTDVAGYSGNTHPDQHALAFIPSSHSILLGNDGGVWETSNLGTTWSDLNNGLGTLQFYSIAGNSASLLIGGTQDNGCEQKNQGTTWNRIRGGDGGWVGFEKTNPNIMYCNHYFPYFEASYDGGKTWQSANTGINPNDSHLFYAPVAQDPNNPGTLYLGTIRVYKTTNYASSWQDVSGVIESSGILISAIAVAPSNSSVLYLGDTAGNVKVSLNAGVTWIALTSLSNPVVSLAVDPMNPSIVYVALAGINQIYRITYSGGSISQYPLSSLPSNPDVVKLTQDGKIIFVGTDQGVYYSTNSGKSWSPLGSGLPNSAVFDMIVTSDEVFVATHGRGVWSISYSTGIQLTISYSVVGGGIGFMPPTLTYFAGGVQKTVQLSSSPSTFSVDPGSRWNVTNPLIGSTTSERWQTNQPTSGIASSPANITLIFYHQYIIIFNYTVIGGGSVNPSVSYKQYGSSLTNMAPLKTWVDSGTQYSYQNQFVASNGNERWSSQNYNGIISSSGAISAIYYHQYRAQANYIIINAGFTSTLQPALSYTSYGSMNIQQLSNTVSSIWLDAGSKYSLTNPVESDSQKLYTLNSTSGIAILGLTISPAYYLQYQIVYKLTIVGGGSGFSSPVVSYISLGSKLSVQIPSNESLLWVDAGSRWNVTNPLIGSTTSERWQTNQPTSGIASSPANIAISYYHQYKEQILFTITGGGSGYSSPKVNVTSFGTILGIKANTSVWADSGSTYSYQEILDGSSGTERWVTGSKGGVITTSATVLAIYYHQYNVSFDFIVIGDGTTFVKPSVNLTSFGKGSSITANKTTWVDSGSRCFYPAMLTGSNSEERWIAISKQSFVISSSKSVAVFYQHQFFVTIKAMEVATKSIQSGGWYNATSDLELFVVPRQGWSFQGWSGTYNSKESNVTVKVNSPVNATALLYPELTIKAGSGGTVSYNYGSVSGQVGQGSTVVIAVPVGTKVILNANPSSIFYVFSSWNGTAGSPQLSIIVDSPEVVNAGFVYNYVFIGSVSSAIVAVVAFVLFRTLRAKKKV
jgi:photosystem II stability/assembly factor-like uncharacterized protein